MKAQQIDASLTLGRRWSIIWIGPCILWGWSF